MPNQLFNKFGNMTPTANTRMQNPMTNAMNMVNKIRQLQSDPTMILDELVRGGKITQEQYNDLQRYKNDPHQIVNYLLQNGNPNQQQQLNSIQQIANQLYGKR